MVSAGGYHSLAVRADGSLWAWGSGGDGRLGLGDNNDRNVPARVGSANDSMPSKVLTAAIQPANAANRNVAWVSSDAGVATVEPNGLGATVTAVSAGMATITVTTQDGGYTVSCVVTVVAAPVSVTVAPKFDILVTGGTQVFAATVTGTTNTAVTWSATGGSITQGGAYTAPMLTGVYTVKATSVADASESATATVVVVDWANDWAAVSAGWAHSLALKADGSLWAWGSGGGQLGLGDWEDRNVPARVGSASG
jgi:hypothetical protein